MVESVNESKKKNVERIYIKLLPKFKSRDENSITRKMMELVMHDCKINYEKDDRIGNDGKMFLW